MSTPTNTPSADVASPGGSLNRTWAGAHSQMNEDNLTSDTLHAHLERQLKRKLIITERAYSKLKEEYDKAKQHIAQLSGKDSQERDIYKQQAKKLVQVIEKLLDDRNELRISVELLEKEKVTSEKRIKQLEKETNTMRELLSKDLNADLFSSKRTQAEEKFWSEVATPELLVQSKPPTDFQLGPVERKESDRDMLLKKKESELIRLKREHDQAVQKAEAAQKDNLKMRETLSTTTKAAREELHKKELRLVGAMRRTQWVVQKQEEEQKRYKSQESYILKLERKVLQQSKKISKLEKKLEVAKQWEGTQDDVDITPTATQSGRDMGLEDSFSRALGEAFTQEEIEGLHDFRGGASQS